MDKAFIANVRRQFLTTYAYLIGPRGFPVLGRSVCYRMAASRSPGFWTRDQSSDYLTCRAVGHWMPDVDLLYP